jgi:lysosomal acid lipase/cholesteryl ester hydrolase
MVHEEYFRKGQIDCIQSFILLCVCKSGCGKDYSNVLIKHWFQIIRTGRFQMYNEYEEFFSYGHAPPSFPIAQITVPIALFQGGKDLLVDFDFLNTNLPHPLLSKQIEHYEHLDFLWASDTSEHVFPDVINLLKKKNKPLSNK